MLAIIVWTRKNPFFGIFTFFCRNIAEKLLIYEYFRFFSRFLRSKYNLVFGDILAAQGDNVAYAHTCLKSNAKHEPIAITHALPKPFHGLGFDIICLQDLTLLKSKISIAEKCFCKGNAVVFVP